MDSKPVKEKESQLRNRGRNEKSENTENSVAEAVEQAIETSWTLLHFYALPEWLQDNEYIHHWYRPPLPSFEHCLKSIFRIHTETINIWTHLIGCFAFVAMTVYFWTHSELDWREKIVMSPYLIGAICCLGFSFAFHTFTCHSEAVGRFFGRLDYFGIALLITCSFIPSLYYAFYCHHHAKIFYMSLVVLLGIACGTVTLWEKFSEPRFRPFRAGVFVALGLFGIVPTVHLMLTQGYWETIYEASFSYLILMASLYLCGAVMYALRIPERFFPGRCDVLFHSHQFMHTLVVIAAFVHYHGITTIAQKRLNESTCDHE